VYPGRMTTMVRAGLAALAALTVACGSGVRSGGPASLPDAASPDAGVGLLDCAYLTGANNCWRSTIAAAAGCLPSRTDHGTVSADGKTCTYASGPVVVFDNPLTASATDGPWSFAVTSGGKECLRFTEPSSHDETLTTAAGTLSLALVGAQADLELTCPGGMTYSGSQANLAGCTNALPTVGIGSASSPSPGDAGDAGGPWNVSFSLGTGVSSETLVFQCGT
jgi:hypothetical protein